ncbi:MAG: hypothetical protein SangKO_067110 [Sandaracinaceae bacterium]
MSGGLLVVEKEIGRGAFGTVFRGTDPLRGPVAVKRLRQIQDESYYETDEAWAARKRDMLLDEGLSLAAVEHPNVVRVYYASEVSETDEIQLVMELMTEGSAEDVLDLGPMPLDRLRDLATETALGLQAVHSAGMLHRDVKPGNIMIGSDGRARLSDFGFVTDTLAHGYGSRGQPYFPLAAPEVICGGPTSTRSDIYAFGGTIFRLLHGATWMSWLDNPIALNADGDFLQNVAWLPHVPRDWRRAVRSFMNPDPERRPQTMGQVLDVIGLLSTDPPWSCDMAPTGELVTWTLSHRGRRIVVEWALTGTGRTRTWHARSQPANGDGRSRTRGNGTRFHELERFFRDFKFA